MKTVTLNYSTDYVNDSILNTIKIIVDYRMDKQRHNGYNRIWNKLNYLDFSTEEIDLSTTKLSLKASKAGGKLNPNEEEQVLNNFLYNLEKVLSKDITLPADILNIDPYKPINKGQLGIQLVSFIVAIVAILYGLYVIFK